MMHTGNVQAAAGDIGRNEHIQIAFGKPGGVQLPDGDLLTFFWCTAEGVTHTRWVRLSSD